VNLLSVSTNFCQVLTDHLTASISLVVISVQLYKGDFDKVMIGYGLEGSFSPMSSLGATPVAAMLLPGRVHVA
jgi:hypothetical protein